MKRLLAIFTLFCCVQTVTAQHCAFSGQVKGAEKPVVSLRMLTGGYYPLQRQMLEVAADGEFRTSISLNRPLFAFLTCNDVQYMVLLSPGRDVHISLEKRAGAMVTFAGAGAPENLLLQELKEDELLFFYQHGKLVNAYAGLGVDSFQTEVLRPVKIAMEKKQTQIAASTVPPALKELLRSEMEYHVQCAFEGATGTFEFVSKNKDSDTIRQLVMQMFPLPDSTALISGYYANQMLSLQCRYAINRLGKGFKTAPEAAKARISAALGIPFESIEKLIASYGETYALEWLYARRFLPRNIRDRVVYNKLMEACDAANLGTAMYLKDTLLAYFPESPYSREAMLAAGEVGKKYQDARHNKRIVFHDTVKPATLRALLETYRGKPIYLDIWGTWCGPCKFELSYARELKKAFPAGEVAFVYLAMDADSKEQTWKEMVRITGLEGEHYRLTGEQIRPIWEAIRSAGGETNRYPTYVLVDRTGQIIHANAGRPSDGESTIRQIKATVSK